MKQRIDKKLFPGAALLLLVFGSCQREEITELSAPQSSVTQLAPNTSLLNSNGNSSAAHIAASEKLAIPPTVAVPENLPLGNTRVATYYAVGVQKYKAREKAGVPGVYEWAFVAPQADLFDATNAKVGTHGAGPFWQLTNGDVIYGQQYSPPRTATSPDEGSIDWLLLMPKTGTTATGIFTDVLYIQRIATKGGKAPITPPSSADETVDVKYKAVYRFTKKNM